MSDTTPRWTATTWVAGLLVAGAGAALTVVGLYTVAVGSGQPSKLAALYPVCTDGLALVAYAATRLLPEGPKRRYAWTVVVLCAGLSAAAQGVHLYQGTGVDSQVDEAWLRFGVGCWPAVSVAVAAHLIWLVGTSQSQVSTGRTPSTEHVVPHDPAPERPPAPTDGGRQDHPPVLPAVPTPVLSTAGQDTGQDGETKAARARVLMAAEGLSRSRAFAAADDLPRVEKARATLNGHRT